MNAQQIKEQLRTKKNVIDEVQPKPEGTEEEKEEEKYWQNPNLHSVLDYDLTDEDKVEHILSSFTQEDIDYRSRKSMNNFREFFYDMVRAFERFENHQ